MISKENLATIDFLFDEDLLDEIQKVGQLKKVIKGDLMIDLGERVSYIPLLLEGAIKVVREDES